MHELIQTATAEFSTFLANHLPNLGKNWWETHVLKSLTFEQKRIAKEKGFTDLEQLDFAALLRILDQNWTKLSQAHHLPRDTRSWVKELKTVRNRWAHLSAHPVLAEDLYRDADTLGRVLEMLGAAPDSIAIVKDVKMKAVADMSETLQEYSDSIVKHAAGEIKTSLDQSQNTEAVTVFKVGDLVVLRSNPDTVIPIIGVEAGTEETQYQVFQDNRPTTYYESQLLPYQMADSPTVLTAEDLRAYLTSVQLLSPSTTNLYSLRSGRVHFVPYQYRPVLRLIRADRPRLLIADEVGVGKTIEAGLIIKELRARLDISSILIICPKALVAEHKWFIEMKRFDEHFMELDGPMLRHCLRETALEGEWPNRQSQAIIPFSLFDSNLLFGKEGKKSLDRMGLLSLDPPPRFDLVIVDEAHHIRNSDTFLHQAVRYFCDNAQATVFLTATPVQLGSRDLFTLLNVLRPDLIIDRTSFEQMAEPNRFINAAVHRCRAGKYRWQVEARSCLDYAAQTEWGRLFLCETPAFQNIHDELARDEIDDNSRIRIIRSLEEFYTFSSMINRTRRRDIGKFATRRPETLTVEFTTDQHRLYDSLMDIVSRILARTHGERNVKFMMTTIRRQAASCLYGLAPLLRDILTGQINSLEAMDRENLINPTFLAEIRSDIQMLLDLADELDRSDPKVKAFVKVLRDKGRMPNNKVLVFSTFHHTLSYIEKHVAEAGLRYGLVHGKIPYDQRAELRRRFTLPKNDPEAIEILLSSEVGSEGLDFQFCDFLVNYDLPWNPMRIEQRIGRIDRYGQPNESVAIVNLVTPGTIDADIYERCLMRIGVFHHAIGGSEEILGEITQEINNIADSFALTPEQRAKRLQQLSDNKIHQVQEEAALEEKQAELFGLTVPNQSWRQEIADAESYWLSQDSLERCVASYLSSMVETGNFLLGSKSLMRLRLSQTNRAKLLEDFRRNQTRSNDPVSRQWEKWLGGADPMLLVTFDQETAANKPDAVHLNVLHPLVRQAARFHKNQEAAQVNLVVSSETLLPGKYPFALYQWRKIGVRVDDKITAVALDLKLDGALMALLERATDELVGTGLDKATMDKLDRRHHRRWRSACANHIEENRGFVRHRMQSLSTSHRARCRLLEDQIKNATNDKICRMRQSELARANHDYKSQMVELEKLAEQADVHATLLVQGSLRIEKKVAQ